MNKIIFDYSMKNIPIPPRLNYLKCLIALIVQKVEKFIKLLQWKPYLFGYPSNTTNDSNVGFLSGKAPPQNEHLNPIEDDLYGLFRNIEFKRVKNEFQKKLK